MHSSCIRRGNYTVNIGVGSANIFFRIATMSGSFRCTGTSIDINIWPVSNSRLICARRPVVSMFPVFFTRAISGRDSFVNGSIHVEEISAQTRGGWQTEATLVKRHCSKHSPFSRCCGEGRLFRTSVGFQRRGAGAEPWRLANRSSSRILHVCSPNNSKPMQFLLLVSARTFFRVGEMKSRLCELRLLL